jgi:polyisoprenoid-binding protein YceI
MRGWLALLIGGTAALMPVEARSDEIVLRLVPAKTAATFQVSATFFDIEGALTISSGQIRLDRLTGEASGQVMIDLRSTKTGNRLRDWEMHRRVLESERYPLVVFRVERLLGTLPPSGTSDLMLAGIVMMHGAEHALAVPLRASVAGDTVSATALFEIPYVAWGLRDPSMFFLRVAPVAAVSVRTAGDLRVDPDAVKQPALGSRANSKSRMSRATR